MKNLIFTMNFLINFYSWPYEVYYICIILYNYYAALVGLY
jgi:hypothetical protein